MIGDLYSIDNYTRRFITDNPYDIFVFGDNMERRGMGGQAKECRGLVNTVGIPTKWRPGSDPADFFKDSDFNFVSSVILGDFVKLTIYRQQGFNVWWPSAGVGTGLSRLPEKAPKIYEYIQFQYQELKKGITSEY